MDLKIIIEKLIKELSQKTNSDDLKQIIKFNDHREYGLAFEWICAEYIEKDFSISADGKMLLLEIYDYLKDESLEEWNEIELEKKIHSIKVNNDSSP